MIHDPVIFTGSRKGINDTPWNQNLIDRLLRSIQDKLPYLLVVIGDANGVDTLINDSAKRLNIPRVVYWTHKLRFTTEQMEGAGHVQLDTPRLADGTPNWKGMYVARDRFMVDQSKAVRAYGIWNGQSTGTIHTLKHAVSRKIPSFIYNMSNDPDKINLYERWQPTDWKIYSVS